MDERIAAEATRLMPRALRSILEKHADDLRAGLRETAGDETRGGAAARADALASEIVAMIDGHRPFEEVARRMGALARVVGDLNNPLLASDEDPHEYRYVLDFEEYVESNIDRYPLVFYGWQSEALDSAGPAGSGDVRRFAAESVNRARRYYRPIGRAYAPDNPEPLARRFDVRSLPFGIGSLSYSYSVTDTARIWRHIWRRAHGDMSGTPYLVVQTRPASGDAMGSARGDNR
jgi:hypothetical protein